MHRALTVENFKVGFWYLILFDFAKDPDPTPMSNFESSGCDPSAGGPSLVHISI
jgi:hypothetical protein